MMMSNIGDNQPPAYEAMSLHIEELLDLAKNTLTGDAIETEAQAAAVKDLQGQIKQAAKDAEAQRKAEKKPHDDAGKEVQARWKPLLDKAKVATDTAAKALTPYLQAQEAERQRIAKEKRDEAERLEAEARAKIQETKPDDLEARYEAEETISRAKKAAAVANKVDRTATGLRTSYKAEITDPLAFGKWAWENRREKYMQFLETLAASEARAGVTIDGLTIHTLRNAA